MRMSIPRRSQYLDVVGGVGVDSGGDGGFHGICRHLFVPCIPFPFYLFSRCWFHTSKVCLPMAEY